MRRPFYNNQIRAREVRVVDADGKQLGVMLLQNAFQLAMERGLDLVQVTEKVEPPVCRIIDYGKYLYTLQKKERGEKEKKGGEVKGIRLGFNIAPHDLEIKAKLAEKFLNGGNKVRVEMRLRGRENLFSGVAKEKMYKFLETIQASTEVKIEKDIRKEPRGFTMIISK